MRFPNLALSGKAGSGKDTVADYLVSTYGYTRLALADPLKEMALNLDPVITYVGDSPIRLSRLIELHGWDSAKRTFPEIRRTLQRMGQTVREYDSEFWLRVLYGAAYRIPGPIVVSDVRYPNEYSSLSRAGYVPVRVARPDVVGMSHESETALDSHTFAHGIANDGSVIQLHYRVDVLLGTLAE